MPWNSRRWPIFRCRTIDSTVSNRSRCDCNKSMCLSPTYSMICWRTSFDGLEIGQDSRIILVCCNIRLYLVFHRLNIPWRLWTQAARVCVLKESREVFAVRMRWHLVRRWMKPHIFRTYHISCRIRSSLRTLRQASYNSEHSSVSFRSRHCTHSPSRGGSISSQSIRDACRSYQDRRNRSYRPSLNIMSAN